MAILAVAARGYLSRHGDNASDIFVTRDLIVVERQSG
jgi:hypothetical protein